MHTYSKIMDKIYSKHIQTKAKCRVFRRINIVCSLLYVTDIKYQTLYARTEDALHRAHGYKLQELTL